MFKTTDEMEKRMKIAGVDIQQSAMVHGFCGIFAIALHDKLGCEIRKLVDAYGLVHAYGIIKNPYGTLYLDARGWTRHEELLLDEFHELCDIPEDDDFVGMPEYGYGYGRVEDIDRNGIDEFRQELRNSLTADEYNDIYAQSIKIVEEWNFPTAIKEFCAY